MASSALENFDSKQFDLLNWFMWGIALSTTTLRLFVRYRNLKRFFWDDGWVSFGMICLTIMAVMNQLQRETIYMILGLQTGLTPKKAYNTPEKVASAMIHQSKLQFVFMMFFWTTLWSVKASLLMFYRRLFIGVQGYMRWWWVVVGICVVTWLMSFLSNFMDCMPLRRRFSLDPKDACPSSHALNAIYMATTVDVVSDMLIMVLPIRLLIGLRISTKQKLGISGIFCLGFVIVFFSIIRMVKVRSSISTNNPNGNVSLALWSILEGSVAIVVGSLPTLKSLITRRGDTGYSSGPKASAYGGGYATHSKTATASHIARGPHIRLHDLPGGVHNDIRAGYESDEALNKNGDEAKPGIMKTQEVSVSSRDIETLDGRNESLESFRHA